MRRGYLAGAILAALVSTGAPAAETVTYTYDALGRLTGVVHAGGDNDAMTQGLNYDAAGNRTQYQVTGSKNKGLQGTGVIVLPLNGFTIIPMGLSEM